MQREIRSHDSSGQRKYLKEFRQAFRSYDSVIDPEQLRAEIRAADVILVGDYHALPASQRFAASLIEERAQPGDRHVVLGVEAIFSRDQPILDAWWRREITEEELRRRTRFDLDWGYEWAPFYELLVSAREHCEGIYGLDCMPRGDFRRAAIHDRHAAKKISEIQEKHPDAVIVVLFGESHLAPRHLPRLLREDLGGRRVLTVLQNVDALYWQAEGELGDGVDAVRVNKDVVCIFNSTPLEKYEHYRLCLERWGGNDAEPPDMGPTVYNLLTGLTRFLGIDQYSSYSDRQPKLLVDQLPEVHCQPSDEHLQSHDGLLKRIEERGCAFVPANNTFYIREFRMAPAAEEVARFLYHACRNLAGNKDVDDDVFYDLVLENCLSHFVARVLCAARIGSAASLLEDRDGAGEWEHWFDGGTTVKRVSFEVFAQQLGYRLGNQLYQAYLHGWVSKSFLRTIFLNSTDSTRDACMTIHHKLHLPKTRRRHR